MLTEKNDPISQKPNNASEADAILPLVAWHGSLLGHRATTFTLPLINMVICGRDDAGFMTTVILFGALGLLLTSHSGHLQVLIT